MTLLLDSCCGCIELRKGSFIIGYIKLVAEIIIATFALVGVVTGGIVITADGDNDDEDAAVIGAAIVIMSAILLVSTLLYLVFTIFLIVGLHQSIRGYIKAYMIFATLFLILNVILWLTSMSTVSSHAAIIIVKLIFILIGSYFLLVIRSYYYKMDEQMKPLGVYSA